MVARGLVGSTVSIAFNRRTFHPDVLVQKQLAAWIKLIGQMENAAVHDVDFFGVLDQVRPSPGY